ncbi:putative monovalent cation/H+ antiporter subunit C [Pyrococcus sp. NA2]|uniref:cation:proton antiporter subunit C n=1 Tax=Pyrococcus sp. (strain NA2) TaxID=342949 RepID=UPI000209AA18|nr:cation:proton antiporter subunit C [Pyrococcus sp. NA2]AEC52538.1 putative monovalent cation/H+ antiporter subunit C [Pyrococcus sp. NA2]
MFEVIGIALFGIGLIGIVINRARIKQVLSLNLLALGVVIYLIGRASNVGMGPPLKGFKAPVDPLPAVLMLTTLVVDVAVTALALSFLMGEEK